jgi:rubrerythrin
MMSTDTATTGIVAEDNRAKRDEILEMLAKAYWMEVETVMSYLANSVNPDGVVITILRDEERHRRLFEGYLREYRAERLT